jgi:hypothetical protein
LRWIISQYHNSIPTRSSSTKSCNLFYRHGEMYS